MSREIKIRVWDKLDKVWRELPDLYGDYQASAYRTYGDPFSIVNFLSSEAQELFQKGELVIQEFTGIKDKTGTEVYEGDILEISRCHVTKEGKLIEDGEQVAFVFYSNIWTGFVKAYKAYDDIHHLDDSSHRIKVIGNIFEHSDLIKKNANV